ncbi:MAG: DNA adenine methylase [Bacillus subtilis]|nr:DNA adenine methylase [Bacillus subtilis]
MHELMDFPIEGGSKIPGGYAIKPVKWAGGKRQIIDVLKSKMPPVYNLYIEPFFGGGALFFDILPKRAIINDINKELLSIYKSLTNKGDFELLVEALKEHEKNHCEEYYYETRNI